MQPSPGRAPRPAGQAPIPPTRSTDAASARMTLRTVENIDLIVACALVILAAFAVALLPEGNVLRLIIVLPTLFFAPGYLLIQALPIAATRRWSRMVHGLVSIGISPGIVGLLALSTALVPGGFRPIPIITVLTFTCVLLTAVGIHRRTRPPATSGSPTPPRTGTPAKTRLKTRPDTAK